MLINRRPLTDLVYDLLAPLDGMLAPVVARTAVVPLANSSGVFGAAVTVEPRRIVVTLDLHPVSRAARHTLLDALASRLGGGRLLELSDADTPDRFMRVRWDAGATRYYPEGVAYGNPWCALDVAFLAADPAREDIEPVLYALTTSRTACPVGTQISAPLLWLFGASTPVVNPVVILRDHTGAEVSRLTFTVSLAASDALAIDCATQTISRTVAGVVQTGANSGLACLTSGVFPILSDEDAIRDASAWPTLELTSTSGTATGAVSYAKRW